MRSSAQVYKFSHAIKAQWGARRHVLDKLNLVRIVLENFKSGSGIHYDPFKRKCFLKQNEKIETRDHLKAHSPEIQ